MVRPTAAHGSSQMIKEGKIADRVVLLAGYKSHSSEHYLEWNHFAHISLTIGMVEESLMLSLPLKLFSIVKLLLPRPHLAPSTTPDLFTPFHFSSVDGKTSCAAVDGDLMMNNPTTAAITHVLHNKGDFQSVNGAEETIGTKIEN
ncbi:putative inactive patatin-like protein 9 [Glycine max]|nr:putative inactive patatin-like protein 9 [Glycine max]